MMWWFIAGTSLFLIGIGTWLIVRDVEPEPQIGWSRDDAQPVAERVSQRRSFWQRFGAFKLKRDAAAAQTFVPDPVIPVVPLADTTHVSRRPVAAGVGVRGLMDAVIGALEESGDLSQPMPRLASLEGRWRQAAPQLDLAIVPLNELLSAVQVVIGQQGEQGWSPSNSGYGVYRRLLFRGQSIAWIRTEVQHDGAVMIKVRSQSREHAMINRQRRIEPWPLTETLAANELSSALLPMAEYAAWLQSEPQTALDRLRQVTTSGVAPETPRAPAPMPPYRPRIEQPVKTMPLRSQGEPVAALIETAIGIVNGAFTDVGGRLVPRDPGTVGPAGRSFSYHVLVKAVPAGLVVIAETPTDIEISVGVPDPARIDLAKRHSVPLPQSNAYELAEAIATCVWPTIAAVNTPGHITH